MEVDEGEHLCLFEIEIKGDRGWISLLVAWDKGRGEPSSCGRNRGQGSEGGMAGPPVIQIEGNGGERELWEDSLVEIFVII